MNTHKKNIFYALYDIKDNYIVGFDTIDEINKYLNTVGLSVILNRYKDKASEVNKIYIEEENIFECSQCIFTYTYDIKNCYGDNLGKGCKIYKFWEE